MMTLSLLDMIIIGATIVSAVIGLFRGMTKEAITLLTWVIASVVAIKYGVVVGNMFGGISTDLIRHIIGGFLIFIGILIIGGVINIIVSKCVKVSGFVVLDKILGAGFGVLRSILVVLIVIPIVNDISANEQWWKDSILIPKLHGLADDIKAIVPESWTKQFTELEKGFAVNNS